MGDSNKLDAQYVRSFPVPVHATVYVGDDYMAVGVIREGGTPEWVICQVVDGKLTQVPPDEAEEHAYEKLGLLS